VLSPMGDAVSEAQRLLEQASTAPVTDLGLARLATDQCAAWPTDADQRVQARFDEADNEVLLTSSMHSSSSTTRTCGGRWPATALRWACTRLGNGRLGKSSPGSGPPPAGSARLVV